MTLKLVVSWYAKVHEQFVTPHMSRYHRADQDTLQALNSSQSTQAVRQDPRKT